MKCQPRWYIYQSFFFCCRKRCCRNQAQYTSNCVRKIPSIFFISCRFTFVLRSSNSLYKSRRRKTFAQVIYALTSGFTLVQINPLPSNRAKLCLAKCSSQLIFGRLLNINIVGFYTSSKRKNWTLWSYKTLPHRDLTLTRETSCTTNNTIE